MPSLLILSSADVKNVIPLIPLSTLLSSTAQTMYALSTSSTSPVLERSEIEKSGEAVQNPKRIMTDTVLHKYLYMPSRLVTDQVCLEFHFEGRGRE